MRHRFYLALVGALLLAGCATAAELPGPHNVLFVGNSFTYYNNSVHNHYRALLRSASPDGERSGRVRIMTISGGRLPEHAAGLRAMLASHAWDVVVLQGHSLGPISEETAGPFQRAARDYAQSIRASGAQPALFMTWAYSGKPDMTGKLERAYSDIGDELNAQVIPVGRAFATVTRERPNLALRIADAKHPTLAGTYLAACMFVATLHDVSPVGLAYSAGLDGETAAYLQAIAWRTARDD